MPTALRELSRRTAVLFLPLLLCASCAARRTYVTEYGMGPDKWATAWLLTRILDPSAELIVTPQGVTLAEGIPFDVPQADVRRVADKASFEIALERARGPSDSRHAPEDLAQLARIVHEIEVDFWNQADSPPAELVEDAFRRLQKQHGRDSVPAACYLAFFERVHGALRAARETASELNPERLTLDCEQLASADTAPPELVSELDLPQVLSAIAGHERVVFVDVREPEEFAEGHIPGAISAAMRDIGPDLIEHLRGADHVVSYCVKDFRGFEMAKALTKVGVAHSSIMKPYGIKGWVAAGMPTAGRKGLPEAEAELELKRCADDPRSCAARRTGVQR